VGKEFAALWALIVCWMCNDQNNNAYENPATIYLRSGFPFVMGMVDVIDTMIGRYGNASKMSV